MMLTSRKGTDLKKQPHWELSQTSWIVCVGVCARLLATFTASKLKGTRGTAIGWRTLTLHCCGAADLTCIELDLISSTASRGGPGRARRERSKARSGRLAKIQKSKKKGEAQVASGPREEVDASRETVSKWDFFLLRGSNGVERESERAHELAPVRFDDQSRRCEAAELSRAELCVTCRGSLLCAHHPQWREGWRERGGERERARGGKVPLTSLSLSASFVISLVCFSPSLSLLLPPPITTSTSHLQNTPSIGAPTPPKRPPPCLLLL